MRQIIGAFGILFIMMANIFICTGLIGASGQVAAAKEYKSQAVSYTHLTLPTICSV